MGTSALLFSNIEDDDSKDPNGKTRTEKMLELSRQQIQEEMSSRRDKLGPVLKFLVKYIWDPLATWFRFFELLALFSPVLITGVPLLVGVTPTFYRNFWYKFLVKVMDLAGPSFIKLGQWAASRSDIFPAELIGYMSQLHSHAQRHSMSHTRRVVMESFGKPFEECFEEFDESPLGVGAMGQVYRARYRSPEYSGDVAVKVLHPNVDIKVTRDLKIMMIFAKMINTLPTMEWLSLPGEVETFGRMMLSQMDLRLEAENLHIFNQNFSNDSDISFPKAPLKVSTRELLVEQLVVGVSMEKVLEFCQHKEYDRIVAKLGLDAFLKMLLLHNFIHSDLHAGNIFLSIDGPHHSSEKLEKLNAAQTQEEWDAVWDHLSPQKDRPHLWFIDAGLVTELNPGNRANFVALFKAIATFDGYQAGQLMMERSRTPETVVNRELFALRTERLVNQVKKRTFALGSVGIGDLLATMMDMVRQHHVRMESDFVTVVLSILLLEGIGRRLDPDLDIFKAALPVLRKVSQHQAVSSLPADLSTDDILQMLKAWIVLETRQFINASVQEVYQCVKYDRLSPNT